MRTYSIHFRWLPELLVALGLLIAMPFSIAQTHQMEAGFPDTVNFHQLELRQEVSWTKKLPAGFDIGLEEERDILICASGLALGDSVLAELDHIDVLDCELSSTRLDA